MRRLLKTLPLAALLWLICGAGFIDPVCTNPWLAPNWTYNPATGIWNPNPAGVEKLVNGNFAAWTADNPDSWTINFTETGSNYVTQNPAGQAQIVSDGAFVGIKQTVLTVGRWYNYGFDLTAAGSGALTIDLGGTTLSFNTVATHSVTGRAKSNATFNINRTGAENITIDNATAKELTTAHLFALRNYGKQVAMAVQAVVPANMQGGVVARYSDANNFLLAYHDRTNAHLVKCTGGTYAADLVSAAAAYADNRVIEIRWADANTAQLYYNNVQIGTNQDVTAVPAGNWGGMFATDATVQLKSPVAQ